MFIANTVRVELLRLRLIGKRGEDVQRIRALDLNLAPEIHH